jgi:disulfide oxidoreductase YuzD
MLGDGVSVTYANVADPSALESYQALLAQVPDARRIYPLVFVNEQLALMGSADFYDVAYHVQRVLEGEPA